MDTSPTESMSRRTGTLFALADRVMGGHLADWLLDNEAAGVSVEMLTKRLYAEHHVDVSRTTVTTWLRSLKAAS